MPEEHSHCWHYTTYPWASTTAVETMRMVCCFCGSISYQPRTVPIEHGPYLPTRTG